MIEQQHFKNYQPSADLLRDRVVVITGASSGIGREVALAAAAHGATVVLLSRTLAKLEQVYDEIEAANCPRPAIFPINLESAVAADYLQLFTALDEEFGRVDGLLHNAGLLGALKPVANYDPEQWQALLNVNLIARFMLTKTLFPLLHKASDARVVFTSSGVAVKGRAYWGAYAVSNAASDALMRTFAEETEPTSIRVNAINPGATRTAMRAQAYPAEDPSTVLPPSDLTNRYLYLLGPDSRELHGQRLDAQG